MKKILTYLIVVLMALCMTACAGSKEESQQPAETPVETPAEEPVEEIDLHDFSDDELISMIKNELTGNWVTNGMEDDEKLTFNENDSGHYEGIFDKSYDFTYSIVVDRLDTPNNGYDIEYVITINYDTGDAEDIRFIIGDEGISGPEGATKMLFQTVEHGIYAGMINNFDVWVKQ